MRRSGVAACTQRRTICVFYAFTRWGSMFVYRILRWCSSGFR
ncbi:hypothetical protein I552_6250 [Mycobacterium xenopi 3993]|nr:hypothetical protein I552_6250 [Mycobacterium xenopi 3993]